jgi:hypothetical protein
METDGDYLPALGQFGQVAPEAVWIDATVEKPPWRRMSGLPAPCTL